MEKRSMTNRREVAQRREARLRTPTLLGAENVQNITAELNVLLADVFALYLKTKNFHWLCRAVDAQLCDGDRQRNRRPEYAHTPRDTVCRGRRYSVKKQHAS